MSPPSLQQPPRGPRTDLHYAAYDGSVEGTIAVLSLGTISIDQGDPEAMTPVMLAAIGGHTRVVNFLLSRNANLSLINSDHRTALHISAECGHLTVTTDLVKAGADLDVRDVEGVTPLHLAVQYGHPAVAAVLIDAGADLNIRGVDRATPFFLAAGFGRIDTARKLLHAKANPLLSATTSFGVTLLPLDEAARLGHSNMVRELIKQLGIEGCAGAGGGRQALCLAVENGHVNIMAILMDGGVVDTGEALVSAARWGVEAAVKFLLQRRQLTGPLTGLDGYVNFCDSLGCPALFHSIDVARYVGNKLQLVSPRVVRLLIDAGASTKSAVRLTRGGRVFCFETPLAFTNEFLLAKKGSGVDLSEEQLLRLDAVRRLLLRVDEVHAVSWLWHTNAPTTKPVKHGGTHRAKKPSTPPLPLLLWLTAVPMLRRRARRRGLVMAALIRLVVMEYLGCCHS